MKRIIAGLMLISSVTVFASDRPSLEVTDIDHLGNFKAKYTLKLKNAQGIKCMHLQTHRWDKSAGVWIDKTDKLCNASEDFSFSVTKSYKKTSRYGMGIEGDNGIEYKDVILEYNDGTIKSIGKFEKDGSRPWMKKSRVRSFEGLDYTSNMISETEFTRKLVSYNKAVKAFSRTYDIQFNFAPEALEGVSCVQLSGIKNIEYRGVYEWYKKDKIEICSKDANQLANKINELKFSREATMMPEYDVINVGCYWTDCLYSKIKLTGEYDFIGGVDSFTVILLKNDGARLDVDLPVEGTNQ